MKTKLHWPMIIWVITFHALGIAGLFYLNITNLSLMLGLYFVTCCLGICIGYHRLLTHRSFRTHTIFKRFFATCGTLALQGGPSRWISQHRMHHSESDQTKDPHNAKKGFWYSHIGWLLVHPHETEQIKTMYKRLCRDIKSDPYLRFLDNPLSQILLQVILGGIIWGFFGFGAVLVAIFLRLCFCYHSTWFVNSLCHKWGSIRFKTNTLSRNNWLVALLTWGEGWHNNHHAKQERVKAGLRWWEIDVSYWIILAMSWLGLAWDLRRK